MKKFSTYLAATVLAASAMAQCYPVVAERDVTYSTPYSLKMDIFTPVGAPAGQRPLLVMAHGGSFSAGNKEENTSAEIARRFASRGFTTATINYRLESSTLNLVDSNVAAGAVIRAVSDMKAAVRFFSKDARTTNTYKVDTMNMNVGGNSAGAITAVNYAYLQDTMDINVPVLQYVRDVVRNNGGVNGNSGNAGYYDKVKGVINLAGGVKDTAWIKTGSAKIFSAHGDKDMTVPYDYDNVLNQLTQNGAIATVITLCGSGAMKPKLDEKGITNILKTYVNADHVPWEGTPAIFREVDSFAATFLGAPVCFTQGFSTGVEILEATNVSVYPNPSNGFVTISQRDFTTAQMTDVSGKLVGTYTLQEGETTINASAFSKGLYFVTLMNVQGKKAIRKVVLQ